MKKRTKEPEVLTRKDYLRNPDLVPTEKVLETSDRLMAHIDNPKTIEQWGTLNREKKNVIQGFYYYNPNDRICAFAVPVNGDKTRLQIKTYLKLSPEQVERLRATGNYQKQKRKEKD